MFAHGASLALLCSLAATGCSNILGIGDPHLAADAAGPPGIDACSTLAFTGTVLSPTADGTTMPVSGASVALHRESGAAVYTTEVFTTNATGAFSIPIPAGEPLPFDGYFEINGTGYLDTFSHLVIPTSTDPHQHVVLYSPDSLAALSTAAGAPAPTDLTGTLVLTIVDATGGPVANSTITTDPATTPCYSTDGAHPTCSATATTTDASGLAWIFSVAATNAFQVNASTGQMYNFPVVADSVLFTSVRP